VTEELCVALENELLPGEIDFKFAFSITDCAVGVVVRRLERVLVSLKGSIVCEGWDGVESDERRRLSVFMEELEKWVMGEQV